MATMTIRCDERDKREAARVAEYYGFDLSSVTRAFWKQMGRTGRIPLDLGNEEPNEESLEAIREAERMMRDGTGESYSTSKELIEAALAS
ncbi:type II toxin-antitoxin system RelB/DinJ family antitoxin [Thermophilibacter sp.]